MSLSSASDKKALDNYLYQAEVILNQLKTCVDALSGAEVQTLQTGSFGQVETTVEIPQVQISARYNTFHEMTVINVGTGTSVVENDEFVVSAGTGAGASANVFSKRQIISKPGQGAIVRIDGRFTTPQENNQQLMGIANAGDAAYFGYFGTEFSILRNTGGGVQIQELTFTVAAGGAETADVVINGTTYPISYTATTLVETAGQVAAELDAAVPFYNFTQNDDQVVMRSVFSGPSTAPFTFTATGGGAAVGAFVEIAPGATTVRTVIPQEEWNVDPMPTLNPLNINYYTIVYNGNIEYYIDVARQGRVLVHRFENSNQTTSHIFGVESFRVIWTNANMSTPPALATTNYGNNGSAFIQGEVRTTEDSKSLNSLKAGVTGTLTNILSVRCREVFGTKANLGRIIPLDISAYVDSNRAALIEILINPVVGGVQDFVYKDKIDSISEYDVDGTTVTGGTLIASYPVTNAGRDINLTDFSELILPGETLVIAMRTTGGPASDMEVSFIFNEEV
jgi:hypothetical protein